MNRTFGEFFEGQYAQFRRETVSHWAIDKKYIDQLDFELKPIYKRYLSISCAATVVGHRARRNEYVEGAVEVSHLCIVLALKGLENSACVLLRQSIELILKHIFFSKHPVEYEWVTSHEGYRELTFQKLLDYLSITPEHEIIEPDNLFRNKLNEWFAVLSRYVHIHSCRFMGYRQIGRVYGPNEEILKKLNKRTKEIWPLLTAMLVAYFPRCYFAASALEQRLIRSCLSKELRQRIVKHLYGIS